MGGAIDLAPAAALSWRLRLMGGFELIGDAGPVYLSAPLQTFLALLALRRLTRSHAAYLLWPEADDRHGQARLRTSIWRVRRACPTVLVASGETLSLSRRLSVDVHELADCVSAGRFRVDRPDFDVESNWELLPGWEQEWVLDERERCRQLCLHAQELQARRMMRDGNYANALDVALSVVSSAPLRDSAHRLVIEIHLAESNMDEALRAYTRYQRLLHTELGLDPSPVIQQLLADRGLPAYLAVTRPLSSRTVGPATR